MNEIDFNFQWFGQVVSAFVTPAHLLAVSMALQMEGQDRSAIISKPCWSLGIEPPAPRGLQRFIELLCPHLTVDPAAFNTIHSITGFSISPDVQTLINCAKLDGVTYDLNDGIDPSADEQNIRIHFSIKGSRVAIFTFESVINYLLLSYSLLSEPHHTLESMKTKGQLKKQVGSRSNAGSPHIAFLMSWIAFHYNSASSLDEIIQGIGGGSLIERPRLILMPRYSAAIKGGT